MQIVFAYLFNLSVEVLKLKTLILDKKKKGFLLVVYYQLWNTSLILNRVCVHEASLNCSAQISHLSRNEMIICQFLLINLFLDTCLN